MGPAQHPGDLCIKTSLGKKGPLCMFAAQHPAHRGASSLNPVVSKVSKRTTDRLSRSGCPFNSGSGSIWSKYPVHAHACMCMHIILSESDQHMEVDGVPPPFWYAKNSSFPGHAIHITEIVPVHKGLGVWKISSSRCTSCFLMCSGLACFTSLRGQYWTPQTGGHTLLPGVYMRSVCV